MERWVEDIRMAIDLAEQSSSPNTDLLFSGLPDNSKFCPRLYGQHMRVRMCVCAHVDFNKAFNGS